MQSSTLLLLALLALALANNGCTNTSTCSRPADTLNVKLGDGSAVEGNTYRSAPYGGPYAYFPSSRTVIFEHGLAAIPYGMQFWLAFSDRGTLAPSAGNMTELPGVDDGGMPAVNDQTISVYNNTCSEFYLWVVAQRSTP
ncbi:MAG TPA: hypothetical protein VHV51_19790 [Polyangiaceae bacterium]|jgi:hypothetical protein|nr:hypothetical protein [Polyangiaceae bacterium]